MRNPARLSQVEAEIRERLQQEEDVSADSIKDLEYLLTVLLRLMMDSGIMTGLMYVTPRTVICTSPFAAFPLPTTYQESDDFQTRR